MPFSQDRAFLFWCLKRDRACPGQLIQKLISCLNPAVDSMALWELEARQAVGMLPWHPQASATSRLPRVSICQPGHEAVCWLSDQSCLTGVQGQRATTWLVSVEQQHGSLWKEIPFPLYEASTLAISSPAGTLCSVAEDIGVELIAFGFRVSWEMTLARFSTLLPRLGSVPSCHHIGVCA